MTTMILLMMLSIVTVLMLIFILNRGCVSPEYESIVVACMILHLVSMVFYFTSIVSSILDLNHAPIVKVEQRGINTTNQFIKVVHENKFIIYKEFERR